MAEHGTFGSAVARQLFIAGYAFSFGGNTPQTPRLGRVPEWIHV